MDPNINPNQNPTGTPTNQTPPFGSAPVPPNPNVVQPQQPPTMPSQSGVYPGSGMPGMPNQPIVNQMGYDMAPLPSKSPRKKLLFIIVGTVLFLAVLGVTAVLVLNKKPDNRNGANGAATNSAEKSTDNSLADLTTLEMVGPDLPGYKPGSLHSAAFSDYMSPDGSCEIAFGTLTAAQLPGDDLDAIVAPTIEALRKKGNTVNGPKAGAPLELRSVTSSTVYSLPTLDFSFTSASGKGHGEAHYSTVILKNGDRAVVNRICANLNGPLDPAKLPAIETLAKQVRIKPGN